jgi:hypothetical protein
MYQRQATGTGTATLTVDITLPRTQAVAGECIEQLAYKNAKAQDDRNNNTERQTEDVATQAAWNLQGAMVKRFERVAETMPDGHPFDLISRLSGLALAR